MRRVGIAAVVAITLLGCDSTQPFFGPRVVDVSPALRRTVPELIEAPAVLEATARVDVIARTEGYLLERGFEDGTEIEQDRVLFVLQADAYEAVAQEAAANVARDEAALELLEAGTSPDTPKDEAAVAAARAALAQSRAKAERAQIELSYTTLRAPIDGRIDAHPVDVGNLVRIGDRLATIVQLDPIYASFAVTPEVLTRIRDRARELPPTVQLETANGRVHDRIGRIDVWGGEIDPDTGLVAMRAALPNPRIDLLAGDEATVRLLLGWHMDAVVVPERAVHRVDGKAHVRIVTEGGLVEHREVTLGPAHAGDRVVASGVEEGEAVVVGRSRAAVAGRRVRTERATIPPRATPGLAPHVHPPTPSAEPSPSPGPQPTQRASPPTPAPIPVKP